MLAQQLPGDPLMYRSGGFAGHLSCNLANCCGLLMSGSTASSRRRLMSLPMLIRFIVRTCSQYCPSAVACAELKPRQIQHPEASSAPSSGWLVRTPKPLTVKRNQIVRVSRQRERERERLTLNPKTENRKPTTEQPRGRKRGVKKKTYNSPWTPKTFPKPQEAERGGALARVS